MHGYDIHQKLVADLGEVWHLSQSQAYATLKRLETQGDISSELVPQAKLPPRQLLHLMPQGRERFVHWLRTPSGGSSRVIRMEFLTKLYFTHLYKLENIEQLFNEQRAEVTRNIQSVEKRFADLPASQVFNRMSLDIRVRQLRLVLQWLDDCKHSFPQYSPTPNPKGN